MFCVKFLLYYKHMSWVFLTTEKKESDKTA